MANLIWKIRQGGRVSLSWSTPPALLSTWSNIAFLYQYQVWAASFGKNDGDKSPAASPPDRCSSDTTPTLDCVLVHLFTPVSVVSFVAFFGSMGVVRHVGRPVHSERAALVDSFYLLACVYHGSLEWVRCDVCALVGVHVAAGYGWFQLFFGSVQILKWSSWSRLPAGPSQLIRAESVGLNPVTVPAILLRFISCEPIQRRRVLAIDRRRVSVV